MSAYLNARAIKVTVLLDPAEIATLSVPEGQSRTTLWIWVAGRKLSADIACKSLRKALTMIREVGTDGCVSLIQGKLGPDNVVQECGLVTQLKVAKAA